MEPVKLEVTVQLGRVDEVAADEFIAGLPEDIQVYVKNKLESDGFTGDVEVGLLTS